LFDLVRVDHFRGFEAFWQIDAAEKTAMNGRWVKAPGEALFDALGKRFGSLPIVAEDLGVITTEVDNLRKRYGWPGMKILQFAFDGSPNNPYLPHNHTRQSVVYTGTHDNDTTLGWFNQLDAKQQASVQEYLGMPGEDMPWSLIRSALSSTAQLAVVPLQDLLALGSEHRMNTPGQNGDNWDWQYAWDQVPPDLAVRLRHLVAMYDRLAGL
jgi:4-alpha-glucanotransferase